MPAFLAWVTKRHRYRGAGSYVGASSLALGAARDNGCYNRMHRHAACRRQCLAFADHRSRRPCRQLSAQCPRTPAFRREPARGPGRKTGRTVAAQQRRQFRISCWPLSPLRVAPFATEAPANGCRRRRGASPTSASNCQRPMRRLPVAQCAPAPTMASVTHLPATFSTDNPSAWPRPSGNIRIVGPSLQPLRPPW
jgi:hypothetical protein